MEEVPQKEGKEMLLECGSSLAEREHFCGENHDPTAVPRTDDFSSGEEGDLNSVESLRALIASDILTDGVYTTFYSPFEVPRGAPNPSASRFLRLPLLYSDQTASNRPLKSIERFMEKVCLPIYGNTHTNTSITGSQTTAFVAEARQIVAEETNAKITGKASLDVVLFTGSGVTSAVELLIDCLSLKHLNLDRENRPVVFVGPFEHHSNLVPWRESGCEVVMVPECPETREVDIEALERLLQDPRFDKRLKMGTFTAASNVTGKVCDVDQIAATLHKYGALAFFDYATGAPYLKIDMNPVPSDRYPSASLIAKDALFLSPHKMLGGVGTPGVLILKKTLVSQVNPPSRSGGGTVFYVTNTHHRFLSNRIERYEGGTPNIAGICRAGLAFLAKRKAEEKYALAKRRVNGDDETGSDIPASIEEQDYLTYQRVASHLREHAPNLVLLGRNENGRKNLPIFSFLIRFGERFLHYNYVCAVLNDVFGIQSRGGCQCAGPYSQRLLGLTTVTSDGEVPNLRNVEIEEALLRFKERAELLRPGYTRISLPFKGLRSDEVEYVLKALVWVAKHGWELMCHYRCNHRTGEWRHSNRQGKPLGRDERKWLSHYDFAPGPAPNFNGRPSQSTQDSLSVSSLFAEAFSNADRILAAARSDHRAISEALKMVDAHLVLGHEDGAKLEELRWYVYPKECAVLLTQGYQLTFDVVEKVDPFGALNPRKNAESRTVHRFDPSPQAFGAKMTGAVDHTTNLSNVKKRKPSSGMQIQGCCVGEKSRNSEPLMSQNALDGHKEATTNSKKMKPSTSVMEETSGTMEAEVTGKKASRNFSTWGKISNEITSVQCRVQENATSSASMDVKIGLHPPLSSCSKKKFRHVKPPPKMMRLITQAVMQWEMINEGDKILLGLSGGKDSLSLLHCLLELKRKLPVQFEVEVCTIDPMTPSFDPSPLIPYVESLGLKYHYIRDDIVSRASRSGKDGKMVSSLCAFCARMKRGNLYSCARRNSCNKLALAQHLDDCAESFMMSVMHNGFLRTMKANYSIDAGDIAVIRPMVYCRESLMTDFVKSSMLPVINENCPACFEEPKERARIKKMLSREEILYPNFYDNIRRSLIPLMHDDMAPILRTYTEAIVSKSRIKKRTNAGNFQNAVDSQKNNTSPGTTTDKSLHEATFEELVLELAKRKPGRQTVDGEAGVNGKVCSLKEGKDCIPCNELME